MYHQHVSSYRLLQANRKSRARQGAAKRFGGFTHVFDTNADQKTLFDRAVREQVGSMCKTRCTFCCMCNVHQHVHAYVPMYKTTSTYTTGVESYTRKTTRVCVHGIWSNICRKNLHSRGVSVNTGVEIH